MGTLIVASMFSFAFCISACAILGCNLVSAQHAVAFESATATSAIPSGTFPASAATTAGSGYWCSTGNHVPGQRVTWTGSVSSAQMATGVSITWAYGPGEFRILTSADGGNFEEASGWRTAARTEVSYSETVLFDAPRDVKALAVVMRSPLAWGFFGINDISLLVQPGSGILVFGSEQCLVADGSGVGVSSCLDAIASGSGDEVFSLSSSSQLVSAATGKCVCLVREGVQMQDCDLAAEAGDGRSIFTLTPSSQLKAKSGYCLSASAAGASAAPCSADGGGVAMVAISELDPAPAAHLRDVAALLSAAEARQRTLLQQLKSGLASCKGFIQQNASAPQHVALAALSRSHSQSPAEEAANKIDSEAGVDLAAVKALIVESNGALAAAL